MVNLPVFSPLAWGPKIEALGGTWRPAAATLGAAAFGRCGMPCAAKFARKACRVGVWRKSSHNNVQIQYIYIYLFI
jgi:hypothetical protein